MNGGKTMRRIVLLTTVAAAMATLLMAAPGEAAQSAAQAGSAPKKAASHKTPMHPHQLTLYPHGKPQRPRSPYSYNPNRFNHATPIHNTFMAPRYY
jgi:hypothetical protein